MIRSKSIPDLPGRKIIPKGDLQAGEFVCFSLFGFTGKSQKAPAYGLDE